MGDVIKSHQEYWKALQTYHHSPPERRAVLLSGYILALSRTHSDPKTRELISRFYQKEMMRNAAKSENPRNIS